MGRKRARKRANGEGTVYPYKGRWAGQVTLGTDPICGRQKRVTVYGDTQAEALAKLQKVKASPPVDEMRVRVAVDFWLNGHKTKIDPATVERYGQELAIVRETLGDILLSQLSALELDRWQQGLEAAGVTADKRRRALVRLRQVLKKCQAYGMVTHNVAAIVSLPKTTKKEVRPLTAEQARHLLRTTAGKWIEPLVWLALDTGARLGELLALTWADLNLATAEVFFNKSLKERNGRFRIKETKTPKGRRRVPILAATVDQVTALAKAGSRPEQLVFHDREGGFVRAYNLHRRKWKPLLAEASLPVSTRFHDLRHTCATLLLLENVHPKVVSERLGHSRIEITLNTYSHLLPGMQTSATEALSRLLLR